MGRYQGVPVKEVNNSQYFNTRALERGFLQFKCVGLISYLGLLAMHTLIQTCETLRL